MGTSRAHQSKRGWPFAAGRARQKCAPPALDNALAIALLNNDNALSPNTNCIVVWWSIKSPNKFSGAFRQGATTQSIRAAGNVHARMLAALLVLMYVFTSKALPLQWETIDSVGTAPPPRYMHAATAIDTVEGAVFVFGG